MIYIQTARSGRREFESLPIILAVAWATKLSSFGNVSTESRAHLMRYGKVVKFLPDKGFGFIQPDRGADIFFHVSVVQGREPLPEILAGQAVKYELALKVRKRPTGDEQETKAPAKPERPEATLVELIDKIPGASLEDIEPKRSMHHPRARRKKPDWRR